MTVAIMLPGAAVSCHLESCRDAIQYSVNNKPDTHLDEAQPLVHTSGFGVLLHSVSS